VVCTRARKPHAGINRCLCTSACACMSQAVRRAVWPETQAKLCRKLRVCSRVASQRSQLEADDPGLGKDLALRLALDLALALALALDPGRGDDRPAAALARPRYVQSNQHG